MQPTDPPRPTVVRGAVRTPNRDWRGRQMFQSGIVIASDCASLRASLSSSLRRALGEGPPACPLDALPPPLRADADGLLLLAVAPGASADPPLRLIQEISLRKLRVGVVLLEAGAGRPREDLAALEPYVLRRLRWPAEAAALEDVLGQNQGEGGRGGRPEAGAAPDVIR